ncbi:type IV secretion system protein [Edaphobacter dinghuensis]|uniref:TrbL/VirB6 plasmid conjugal transfer protein n=1 Tax=Edaphobacter dinghuensis TaxID=1560005 RepID=A0A917HQP7_9BACT|nr:type IV secretion system protein [Edaphobacter dinghuensis]GGG87204.1 hypothetical protein GCM10011585_34060 [Edaphobacter dinghuensis]
MLSLFHPSITALAFFQSTQLSLFERFLTQAVSGIDSTSITSGMQNVAYIVLLIGFLWQVYQSALHGGDVRGLGTNLIKYVATAIIVMNYHTVFTAINQGFVNAGNWINSASGTSNLLSNWANDLNTQYNQSGFQNLWGLVTGGIAGLLDGLLIIVAYVLYPFVIAIFGFFYILYGSILYIFGPIIIALMPLGATNRLAKSYVENVFIWNAWPVLYGGFGALLSAVQMGQVGQMLNQNNFLGGLGNLEGSILIGLASIIYSLAIAVIPFIAKRVISGEVGSTAAALVGAAVTALSTGIAAGEGVAAGIVGAKAAAPGGAVAPAQGTSHSAAGSSTSKVATSGAPNQPAPQQRTAPSTSRPSGGTQPTASATAADPGNTVPARQSLAEEHAAKMRSAAGAGSTKPTADRSPGEEVRGTAASAPSASTIGSASRTSVGSRPANSDRSRSANTKNKPSIAPYRLSTWGAYHVARLATEGVMGGGGRVMTAAAGVVQHPGDSVGRASAAAGAFAGRIVNASATARDTAQSVAHAASHPVETAQKGYQAVSENLSAVGTRVADTTTSTAKGIRNEFTKAYKQTRDEEK